MVLGPENGEQEAEEKHHQAEANKADDWKETHTHTHTRTDCHHNKTNFTTEQNKTLNKKTAK